MSEGQTWHYGMVSDLWAKFILDTPEMDYLQQQIQRYGQPVLDLACGAGRLLAPLAKDGIDIDGCDLSEDMLARTRERLDREGTSAELFNQAMHELDLPRRYRVIYCIGSFGLAGSRMDDLEALKRCYTHLRPGGALILNIQSDYTSPDAFDQLLQDYRDTLPRPWPDEGKEYVDEDGTVYISKIRWLEVDPLAQFLLREIRVEKWQDDKLVAEEEHLLTGRYYFVNEFDWMLRLAGFDDIILHGDYEEQQATAEHHELTFIARR